MNWWLGLLRARLYKCFSRGIFVLNNQGTCLSVSGHRSHQYYVCPALAGAKRDKATHSPLTSFRKKAGVLCSDSSNALILLPHWIRSHTAVCDEAVLIDYHSTDKSLSIIRELAPSTWQVVASRNNRHEFLNEGAVRDELCWYTGLFSGDWVINLEVTEFLVASDLRKAMNSAVSEQGRQHLQLSRFFAFNGQSPRHHAQEYS